jgi:glutamate synthase (NADPH/NADH) small chain
MPGVGPLGLNARGEVVVDRRTLMTNLDGVFAAGDAVRGASLVVWAVRDGQVAAAAIHDWVQAQALGTRAA